MTLRSILCQLMLLFGGITFPACNPAGDTSENNARIESAIKVIDYYGEAANAGKLHNILSSEIKAGRVPGLFFTASWCGPCREFKASLHDPLMQDALKGVTFILVDEEPDQSKENLLQRYGISVFPTFVKVDAEGKNLKQIDGGAWDENIPENMAPAMSGFLN